jgi:RHS repeat-associated protein
VRNLRICGTDPFAAPNGLWDYTDSFDSSGRQLSYTNSLGNIQFKRQAGTGLLTNYLDLMGYSTTNIWNTNSCALLQNIDPLALTNSWSYDSSFLYVQRFTNAVGTVAQFAYDASGNLTNYIDTANNTTRFTYDGHGNRTSVVDANSHTALFGYDGSGNLTSVTNAVTNVWRFGYDGLGRLTAMTNQLSQTNGVVWDARSRLTQLRDAFGKTNSLGYDANGNCTSWTNALGYVRKHGYDAANRLTNVTLPASSAAFWSFGYDKMGNLTRITNALGYTNSLGYDSVNRLTSLTNAVNKVWNLALNANGWRTQGVDPNTHTNQFGYDAEGRITAWTNGLQNKVQYQYSGLHRLTNIIDARNNALGFVYQDCCADRLTQIRFAASDLEQFQYDPAGNRTNFINRAGNQVKYVYDNANRLTEKDFVSAADVMKFAYDAANRLTNAVWTAGASTTNSSLALAYDAAGRLTNETQIVGTAASKTVGYEYFDDGRRKRLVYPDGGYITYEYNSNGWLSAIKDSGTTTIVSYLYDAAGYRTNRTLGNNSFTVYQYDAAEHLTNLVNKTVSGGVTNTLSSYAYGYDSAGNRTWVKRSSSRGDVYKYDAADQVTNVVYDATAPDGTPGSGTNQVSYRIDAAGNWTNLVQVVPGTSTNTTVYQVNALNQYTNIAGTGYNYDLNGNFTGDAGGQKNYSYDYENRLKSGYIVSVNYTYTYDALGRWVGRQWAGAWSRYYYAGWQLIDERDGSGNQVAKYVYGPGLDEPIRMTRSGTAYYYHVDGLGNITEVTDASGNLVEQYSYDVYGTPTMRNSGGTVITSSAIGNRWLSQGRDWDNGTKLYNYRYRIYNPSIGRFMQTDPLRSVAGQLRRVVGGANLYRFVGNTPLNRLDRHGLQGSLIPPQGTPMVPGGFFGGSIINDPNDLGDINNEINHGPELDGEGGGSLFDLFFDWLIGFIHPTPEPTPAQLEWDMNFGPLNPLWPPPGGPFMIPARPANAPPTPKETPGLPCPPGTQPGLGKLPPYSGGPRNGPPAIIIIR